MEQLLSRFKAATNVLEANNIDYIVFGGIAVWAYGRRRKTRDIDLLVRRTEAKRTLESLARAGFMTEETDHRWIYKAFLDHANIDIIFEPKGELRLTPEILGRQRNLPIDGFTFRFMDPENLVFLKILATKEIRPADWYDGMSILENLRDRFDWDYFRSKAAGHAAKSLSFLLLADALYIEKTGGHLVPKNVVESLYGTYIGSMSS